MQQHMLSEKALQYQAYLSREETFRHNTPSAEAYPLQLLQEGDSRAMEEHLKVSGTGRAGKLSDDPVRNAKYLTVASVTMTCRAAIQGGLSSERALTISDLYIRKMDGLETEAEVWALERDMFAFYLKEVIALEKTCAPCKTISLCLDYIYNHLHQPIRLQDLADLCRLSPSYLSVLFKKEMGQSVSDYVMAQRMEAACNMLKFSDFTCAEISSILAFSSQSHMTRVFQKYTGMTPRRYREENRPAESEE